MHSQPFFVHIIYLIDTDFGEYGQPMSTDSLVVVIRMYVCIMYVHIVCMTTTTAAAVNSDFGLKQLEDIISGVPCVLGVRVLLLPVLHHAVVATHFV